MNVQLFRTSVSKDMIPSQGGIVRKSVALSLNRNAPFIKISFFILITIFCGVLLIQSVRAEEAPPELQGSGRPIPRFVTIDTDKAYIRTGPAPRYPVKWIYRKSGLPVEITQEFDVWRKIKDIDGDEGWVNKTLLSDKRGVIIKTKAAVELRDASSEESRVIARLENGVMAKLTKCMPALCEISTGGYHGWVQRSVLWGIYPQEEIK